MKLFLKIFVFSTALVCQLAHAQNARNYFKNAFDMLKAKNYQAAEDLFVKGLALDDKDAQAWKYYGESLEANKANMKARRAYVRAIDLMPASSERAILESKISNMKPSLLPGPECRSLVEKIDPALLQGMVDKLKDIPDVVTSKVVLNFPSRFYPTIKISAKCGEIYLFENETYNTSNSSSVSMLGYPHLKLAEDNEVVKSILTRFSADPFDPQATSQSWNYTVLSELKETYSGKDTRPKEFSHSCNAIKLPNPEDKEILFEYSCGSKDSKSNFRTKYFKDFDIILPVPENNNFEILSVEKVK